MTTENPAVQTAFRCMSLLVGALLVAAATGCRVFHGVAAAPRQTVRSMTPGGREKPVDPVEVQQSLLRFSDDFYSRMISGIMALRHGTNELPAKEVLRLKLGFGTETCSIASGPNPVASILEMTAFVTATRIALEAEKQSEVYGRSAEPMLEDCRSAESNIWRFAGTILKPEQQTEFRSALEAWRRPDSSLESVLTARAVGSAFQVARSSDVGTPNPGSVFSLFQVDPLAGLDPAVREMTQARLLAERALYVSQRMPMLLRWQTELFAAHTIQLPEMAQLIANSTQLTTSMERFSAVAEQLPDRLSTEREEVVAALQRQGKELTPLVNEVHQTLAAGSQMSASLNTTIATFDALMKRFGVGEPKRPHPPGAKSEPFRIQDYGQTAAQLEAAAQRLTELLLTVDRSIGSTNLLQLTAQVTPAVQQAQVGGKAIVDYAFWRGLQLLAAALLAALLYRFLTAGLKPVNHTKVVSP